MAVGVCYNGLHLLRVATVFATIGGGSCYKDGGGAKGAERFATICSGACYKSVAAVLQGDGKPIGGCFERRRWLLQIRRRPASRRPANPAAVAANAGVGCYKSDAVSCCKETANPTAVAANAGAGCYKSDAACF
jgi:hypothetical protein